MFDQKELTQMKNDLYEKLNKELQEYCEPILKRDPTIDFSHLTTIFLLSKIAELQLMIKGLAKTLN